MDQILDRVMELIEKGMIRRGSTLDHASRMKIKESLRNQFNNLPEDKRYEVFGLIMSQLGK